MGLEYTFLWDPGKVLSLSWGTLLVVSRGQLSDHLVFLSPPMWGVLCESNLDGD